MRSVQYVGRCNAADPWSEASPGTQGVLLALRGKEDEEWSGWHTAELRIELPAPAGAEKALGFALRNVGFVDQDGDGIYSPGVDAVQTAHAYPSHLSSQGIDPDDAASWETVFLAAEPDTEATARRTEMLRRKW